MSLFFFTATYHSVVYVSPFSYSSGDGPVGWFHFLVIVKSAAINTEVQVPVWEDRACVLEYGGVIFKVLF